MFMNLFFLRFVRILQDMVIKTHIGGVHWTVHTHTPIQLYSSIIRATLLMFIN
jgi:hypothetical protein